MALNKTTLINQATPDAYISELQTSNPKLYQAIKNIGDVLKTVINLSPLTGIAPVAKYSNVFTAIALTPFSVVHYLGTVDVIVSFYDDLGNILIPTSLVITNNNVVTATFALAQAGRVVIVG